MASTLEFLHQQPVTFLNPITRLLWAMRKGERPEYDQLTFFGAREGGKTHAFNWLVCMCLGLNLSVTFYLLRYLKTDIYQSVWTELMNRLLALGWLGERPTDVQARVTYREFRRGNVLVICKGLHQSQRDKVPIKGQFQYTTDYCIAVFEECDEMDLEEHLDIQLALRSPRLDVHAVVINMGNPLRESNQFSRRVDEWLPYNQTELHTRFYDQRVITYPLQIRHLDGRWETVYTRHLVVRHALDANKYALANPRTMAKMAELERTQPQKYLA